MAGGCLVLWTLVSAHFSLLHPGQLVEKFWMLHCCPSLLPPLQILVGYFLLSVVLVLGVFVGYTLYVMLLLCFLVRFLAGTFDGLHWTLLTNLTNALAGVFCERLVSRDCS